MCVFLTLRLNKAQVRKQYDTRGVDDDYFGPVYIQSAFSFSPWPVITSHKPDHISMLNWGLIPHWAKDEGTAFTLRKSTVNARVETVAEKPSFRKAVRNTRCLVLSDGFYEFREVNKKKYPYFIQLKDSEPFAMAGIYDTWTNMASGEIINSFSILTTDANPLMEKIHNRKKRMPVILPPDKQKDWILFNSEPEDLLPAFPDELMEAWSVSNLITSRDSNIVKDPRDLIKPYNYPELQLLDGFNW